MDKELQKKEAEARLKMLGLHPDVLKTFKKSGRLYYSERTPLGGILYWLDNNQEWLEKVRAWEQEHDAMVYHITHEYLEFGECLTLLYVSSSEEEWEMDRDDLNNKSPEYGFIVIGCVMNLTTGDTEFGSVGVKERAGGLIRTA